MRCRCVPVVGAGSGRQEIAAHLAHLYVMGDPTSAPPMWHHDCHCELQVVRPVRPRGSDKWSGQDSSAFVTHHDTPFRLFCCLSRPTPEHRSGRTSASARSFLAYLLSCVIPLDPHVIDAWCITRVQADHHTLPILAAAHSISCSLPVTRFATRKPQGLGMV